MAEKNNNSQQIGDVVKVRHEKLAELVANNADPFVITKFDRTHTTKEIKDNYAEVEGKTVVIAGRLMAKRRMGSVSFGNVADLAGNIQIFIKKDTVGEDEYNKIMESAVLRTNPAKDVFNLMCDTLEYLGYGATIRRIRDDNH